MAKRASGWWLRNVRSTVGMVTVTGQEVTATTMRCSVLTPVEAGPHMSIGMGWLAEWADGA
jgi:hypothetical protein